MIRRVFFFAFISLAIAAAQDPAASFTVTGAVKTPLTLTAADLAKMPRASVKSMSGGLETTFEGVWLHEILKRAGAPLGSELRGKALASYIVADAKDGYEVVYSLAEIDPAFTSEQFLLADTADGKPLVGSQGPFRLVVPTDKPGARSVRMLTKIEVVTLRK
jgi:DMSO/TMAO reductase YedYZ molybdopterin-dependent catalytic subunit